jgi:hypothetical protein
MIRYKTVLSLLSLLMASSSIAVAGNKPYSLTVDPQALAVAQAAFAAMGGTQAILGYKDSLATEHDEVQRLA